MGRLLSRATIADKVIFHVLPFFVIYKDILDEASIEVTPGNRKQIDQAIHQVVEVTFTDCPSTWKRLKQQVVGDEQKRRDLIRKL